MALTNAQIDAMNDAQARAACREHKVNPAGKTLADIKRELKKSVATAAGKSTPADPKAAQKAAASKPPVQAAAKAVTAKSTAATDKAPNFQALLADLKVSHVAMSQSIAALEAAISGGAAPVAAAVEEAPPADEGNIEAVAEEAPAEAAAEEGGTLTHEFIDQAGEEYADTFRGILMEAGYAEADLAACDFATLQATLHEYLTSQEGTATEMAEEALPEPDIQARTALFAASGHALPDNLDTGALEIGMPCVICAPEDVGFMDAQGQPRLWDATVQGVTEDGTMIQVALTNEAGETEAADVPPTHLYVPPPPPAPKPVAKPALGLKKPAVVVKK